MIKAQPGVKMGPMIRGGEREAQKYHELQTREDWDLFSHLASGAGACGGPSA